MPEDDTKEESSTTEELTDDDNSPVEEPSVITEAKATADRIEKANETSAELLKKQEELAARDALGGKSQAGDVEPKEEETPADYANKILSGGLNEPRKKE
tara:strand:- start:1661 stop:1960 length:300 start_codon:yes stop_codon:yes gene_type:complete